MFKLPHSEVKVMLRWHQHNHVIYKKQLEAMPWNDHKKVPEFGELWKKKPVYSVKDLLAHLTANAHAVNYPFPLNAREG